MKTVPDDNPHMWRPYHGPEPFEEVCDLCDVFRYAIHKQLPEPAAASLSCPEPWPEEVDWMTEEVMAEMEAEAEARDLEVVAVKKLVGHSARCIGSHLSTIAATGGPGKGTRRY